MDQQSYGSPMPRRSIYAIYAYIGVVWGVNVGIYCIHGAYGMECLGMIYEGVRSFVRSFSLSLSLPITLSMRFAKGSFGAGLVPTRAVLDVRCGPPSTK